MKLINPLKGSILLEYPKGNIYAKKENLSYFEFLPITIPDFENSFAGTRSILKGLLFNKAMQKKKSMGLIFPLWKTQFPVCSDKTAFPLLYFLLYKLATLTSIILPFQSKSPPFLLKGKCFAFKIFAVYFSHLKPIPVSVSQKSGLLEKYDLQLGLFRIYQARLIQTIEQYFFLFLEIILLQNKQKVAISIV